MSAKQVDHRGGAQPRGSMTLEAARALRALGAMNSMTLRRHLEPVRVGRWLPEGARHWLVLYDAAKVREIARAFQSDEVNPYRPPQYSTGPKIQRPRSPLPHGVPEGWVTVLQLWQAMRAAGYDMRSHTTRDLRNRLQLHGVPSQRRVATTRIERVFGIDRVLPAFGWSAWPPQAPFTNRR